MVNVEGICEKLTRLPECRLLGLSLQEEYDLKDIVYRLESLSRDPDWQPQFTQGLLLGILDGFLQDLQSGTYQSGHKESHADSEKVRPHGSIILPETNK